MSGLVSSFALLHILPIIRQGLVSILVPLNGSYLDPWPLISVFNYVKITNLLMNCFPVDQGHVDLHVQMVILPIIKLHVAFKDALL